MSLRRLFESAEKIQVDMPVADIPVTGVVADNRKVMPGALFVAHKGLTNDAHRFIPDAIARGAAAIVCETPQPELAVPVVYVAHARSAFAQLCAAWYGHPSRSLTVIGITGTDGKTTTANILYGILRAAGAQTGVITTVNAMIGDAQLDTGLHVTTPEAADIQRYLAMMRDAGATHCVLEVTSHGLTLNRVDGVAFDVAAVTNITHEHLDLHGTREAYRAAKTLLFNMAPAHVLNADDDYAYAHLAALPARARIAYSRSAQPTGAGLTGWLHARMADYATGTIDAHGWQAGKSLDLPLRTQLIGGFNVSNVLCASASALTLGVPLDAIQRGVASIAGVPGRMERIDAGQPYLALVDFAHTPNSLDNVLQTVRAITPGKLDCGVWLRRRARCAKAPDDGRDRGASRGCDCADSRGSARGIV